MAFSQHTLALQLWPGFTLTNGSLVTAVSKKAAEIED